MKVLGLGECECVCVSACGVGERGDNRTREQGMNALHWVSQERGVQREEMEEG